ncbi:MAG TPA: prolipoprotein diacylglyceryl transferase [Clostridiales bacterium]|nr:prolipoprotein diacylglyceryl transferase [Clostridiales bacterium]
MPNIDPVAFHLGSLTVRWYGIFITVAILSGYIVSCLNAKRRGVKLDMMLEVFLFAVPLAILGARLSYVLFHAKDFAVHSWSDFLRIFAIRKGGISILGAIPGGALGVYIACKINKVPLSYLLDIIAPGLILGQALGRWGNWANQELYGRMITNESYQVFPIAVFIERENAWFQATFFYEMVLNLIGFAILMAVFYRSKKNLLTFMTYLCWYMVVRAVMEVFREDAVFVGSIRLGVLGCAIAAGISMVITVLIYVGKIRTGKPVVLEQPEKNKLPDTLK